MSSESVGVGSLVLHGDNKWVELGVWPQLGCECGTWGEGSDSCVCDSQGDGTIAIQEQKKLSLVQL